MNLKKDEIKYSSIIEGAYLLVITQNIYFFTRPVMSFLSNHITIKILIIFLSIACINLANLIANWISTKKTYTNYSVKLLFWDTLSLTLMAIFTQIGSDFFDDEYKLILQDVTFITMFSIFYIAIYLTFFAWNIITGYYNDKKSNSSPNIFTTENKLIIIYCLVLFTNVILIFRKTSLLVKPSFVVSLVLSLIILVRYYKINIFSQNHNIVKQKAEWFGNTKKLIKQLIISIRSYVFSIFIKTDDNQEKRVKKFFSSIYSGKLKDEFIFDSTASTYLEKITPLLDIINLNGNEIFDLGCGKNELYNWLKSNKVCFSNYYGYDFAIKGKKLPNGEVKKSNILYENFNCDNQNIFLINVLCYLNDDDLIKLSEKIKTAKNIVVIEPIPSVYWDATFDRIKPFYRNRKNLVKVFSNFSLTTQVIDYAIKTNKFALFPMSCCYLFEHLETTK